MTARLDIKEGLQRALHVTVPVQEWQEKTQQLLQQRAKSAKVDGFRPGKAPLNVVQKLYGAAAEEKALDEVISHHLFAACQANAAFPVGRPTIESLKAEPAQDIEFTATFEVEPVIETVQFSGVLVEKVVSEVLESDVDLVVDNLQQQMGKFEVSTDAAVEGDRLSLDFCGYVDGVAFDGGKAENFQLLTGKNKMIPGFEAPLMGMKAGDSKRITVTFPTDYAEALAGKVAEFDITLHGVEHHIKATADEAFCRGLGVKDGLLSTLRAEIRTTLEREMHKHLRDLLREQVFNKLVEVNTIDVPKSEVHDEIHRLMDQAIARFKEMAPHQKEAPNLPHEMFEPEALKRIKLGYLVRALIRSAELKVSDAEIRVLAEEFAGAYENPAEVIRYHMDDKKRYDQLHALALEFKVVQHLLGLAQVNEKKVLHSELKK